MGLDVYLYRHPDRKTFVAQEQERERREEAVWESYGKYTEMTEAQKDEARTKSEAAGKGIVTQEEEQIALPSAKHPDHYFKIGYFRSSYNDSGIEELARSYKLPGLGDIFPNHEDYHMAVDWPTARITAAEAVAKWKAYAETPRGLYSVFGVSSFTHRRISSKAEALEFFEAERQKWDTSTKMERFESYSNGQGEFFTKGLTVVALIHGTKYQNPCTWVVTKSQESPLLWYVSALEIVVETCDWVMSQPDYGKTEYYLHWSG